MSTVVLLHQHTNNFGDDAAGMALLRALETQADVDHITVCYIWSRGEGGLPVSDSVVSQHHPAILSGLADRRPHLALLAALGAVSPRLVRGELAEMARMCQSADLVYVAPAGSNLGIYKDWTYLLSLAFIVRSGTRPVFCQNSIGPSSSRLFDRIARMVLRRSRVYVRESVSQAFLARHGIESTLGVDTALLLPASDITTLPRRPVITVVPTTLASWHRDHRDFDDQGFLGQVLPEAVSAVARARGLDVEVLAHLYGPEAEDSALTLVAEGLRRHGVSAEVIRPATWSDYAQSLGRSTAVVSMRYHGLVLSGQRAVPCVALAYENKMVEAASYLGQTASLLDVGACDGAAISGALEDVLDRRDEICADLTRRMPRLREAASGPILEARRRTAGTAG